MGSGHRGTVQHLKPHNTSVRGGRAHTGGGRWWWDWGAAPRGCGVGGSSGPQLSPVCFLFQSEYHYEYTACDSSGSRWRVAVPHTPGLCTGLPDPVRGTECCKVLGVWGDAGGGSWGVGKAGGGGRGAVRRSAVFFISSVAARCLQRRRRDPSARQRNALVSSGSSSWARMQRRGMEPPTHTHPPPQILGGRAVLLQHVPAPCRIPPAARLQNCPKTSIWGGRGGVHHAATQRGGILQRGAEMRMPRPKQRWGKSGGVIILTPPPLPAARGQLSPARRVSSWT